MIGAWRTRSYNNMINGVSRDGTGLGGNYGMRVLGWTVLMYYVRAFTKAQTQTRYTLHGSSLIPTRYVPAHLPPCY